MKSKGRLNRRGFLKSAAAGAAAGAAAIVAPVPVVEAQEPQQAAAAAAPRGTAASPSARALAAETEPLSPDVDLLTVENPGSDFMVDVLKTLDFEYIAANPASSFRGLHESLITYGGNKAPEWLTCCHEEAAVNMANRNTNANRMFFILVVSESGFQNSAKIEASG